MSIQDFRSKLDGNDQTALFKALRKLDRVDHPNRLVSNGNLTDWNPWPSAE